MRQIEITPALTAYESRAAGGTLCGMLATNDGGVILIDPGILPAELAFLAEAVGDRPVRQIVQTHAHWDHVMGLSRWPDAPRVASAAFEKVRTQAAQMLSAVQVGLEMQAGRYDPPPALLEPTRLVAGREPLHSAAPGWDLIPAPGHSIDMLALYDSRNHILWAADILSDREPPMMLPGTTAEYLETLDRLSALTIDVLVPAHGRIATQSGSVQDRFKAAYDYLIELRERVQQAIDMGKNPEETVTFCAEMRYPDPESHHPVHADNVRITWGELRGLAGYEDEEDNPRKTGLPVDGQG